MLAFNLPATHIAKGLRSCVHPSLSYRSFEKINNCNRDIDCWNCNNVVKCTEKFFCNKCHRIQPSGNHKNMFEYIGVPVSFNIDESILKKKFRDLQSQLHPDKFAQTSEFERNISEEHSRHLNQAYKILSDPFERAKYLLKILGEGDAESNDLNPASLLEMMEWNERVSELSKRNELKAEKAIVQGEIDIIMNNLGKQFTEKDMDGVKYSITRLSYLYSLRSTIYRLIEKIPSN